MVGSAGGRVVVMFKAEGISGIALQDVKNNKVTPTNREYVSRDNEAKVEDDTKSYVNLCEKNFEYYRKGFIPC